MQKFYAPENNLSGNIPIQTFGHQQGLIELSLHSNSFTGPIPFELGNLNHLSILHLQENKLTGEIPMELSGCSALTELILERNSFYGSIPSFLGSLLSLEILDLSNNFFSSTIPPELVNLTFLNTLNLSSNNLSGEVPYISSQEEGKKVNHYIPSFAIWLCASFLWRAASSNKWIFFIQSSWYWKLWLCV
ncbi:hypothetical protein PIB30_054045 [Stylosanthes scabra]|uniref:Non-specific serine/threonine protein kinase n=1 Tax=Stylosanthes scabra TaxID=79078 RepID=A0ABU6TIE9_9FABA|nr:hypothetical protein [Stylosanthes scabra]